MTPPAHPSTVDPVDQALARLVADHGLREVVDVGGGSGAHAVPLARQGCRVTVVDTSIDALAILRRRAAEAGVADLITAVQADADSATDMVESSSADLVMCHHLLEQLEDPDAVIGRMAAALRPGGFLSIVVPGRLAAVLAQGGARRYTRAAAILADPRGTHGPSDVVRHRFAAEDLLAMFAHAGLTGQSVRGLGILDNLLTASARSTDEPQDSTGVSELEILLAAHPVLSAIGAHLHGIARAPSAV